ncbi:Y4lL [Cyanobium sp. PCC 7001]|nr:Y4lL [Cyanobium sp. PCC 7001]
MPASLRRLHALRCLHRLVPEGLLEPHVQPIVDLHTGEIAALEVLLRVRGGAGLPDLPPEHWIALAEEEGCIESIGLAMFRAGCELLAQPALRRCPIGVNVNLSVLQLRSPQLLDQLRGLAEASAVDCAAICLELTESHQLGDDPELLQRLDRLAACGFNLALDDFGTGYASLAVLRSFPFSHVKVDRSFVADLPHSSRSRALCQVMLQMGEACGLTVTAEGVETAEQLALLQAMGFSRLQGYLFGRPSPAADVELLLTAPLAL